MQIDLKASIRMLSMVILFSLIVVFVMFGDEAKSAVQFLYDSALTLFQVTIMVAIALTTVYLTQAIRETTWFDIRGAAREMGIIRNRVAKHAPLQAPTQSQWPYSTPATRYLPLLLFWR